MISRRKLLYSGLLLTGATLVLPVSIKAASSSDRFSADSDIEQFYQLSLFLTERQSLSQHVSLRALTMLAQEDKDFVDNMRKLMSQITQAGLTHVEQLSDSEPYQSEVLKNTGRKIISAWYLGYTGTPIATHAVDNTRFVTFTEALMFQPTSDATIIPTYSRGQTNYWMQPPASIERD